jgi:hypothetical protein
MGVAHNYLNYNDFSHRFTKSADDPTSFTSVGNEADSRRLAQCRDTVYGPPSNLMRITGAQTAALRLLFVRRCSCAG